MTQIWNILETLKFLLVDLKEYASPNFSKNSIKPFNDLCKRAPILKILKSPKLAFLKRHPILFAAVSKYFNILVCHDVMNSYKQFVNVIDWILNLLIWLTYFLTIYYWIKMNFAQIELVVIYFGRISEKLPFGILCVQTRISRSTFSKRVLQKNCWLDLNKIEKCSALQSAKKKVLERKEQNIWACRLQMKIQTLAPIMMSTFCAKKSSTNVCIFSSSSINQSSNNIIL